MTARRSAVTGFVVAIVLLASGTLAGGRALAMPAGEARSPAGPPGDRPGAAAGGAPGGERGGGLLEKVVGAGLEGVDLRRLEDLYADVDPELRRAVQVDPVRFVRTLGREGLPSPGEAVQATGWLLARELRISARLLARVLLLAMLGALLQQLGRGIGGRGAQEVAHGVVLLALALLALQSFREAAVMVAGAVGQMASVAQALLPTLTAIAAASGAPVTATALHPVLIGVIGLVAELVSRLVLPGLMVASLLSVAGHLSGEFPMSRLASLSQQVALTVLGLSLTLFLGVVAVRGAVAPVADGVTLRAAKYVTGATVPVVGRMMSEAVEIVAGSSVLIKNAVGTAGVILVMLMAAVPVLRLLAIIFVFRLAAALLQPVADGRVVGTLGSLADTLGLLLASLFACGVLFVLSLSALIGATSIPAALR